jgi:HK97 family phage prohead protease
VAGAQASPDAVDTLISAGVDPEDAMTAALAVPATFTRSFALDDIKIRSGGDGRTVEAYAAVFGTPTSIRDGQGSYREQIDRSAFDRTIAHKGMKFGVYFNHGLTLRGRDSELGSVPIGTPIAAPVADSRGLLTVSRYNKSALAESVLESIRNGDITGQSFSGRWVRSTPSPPRGGYRASTSGELPLVTRMEIALAEYGPTPIPAYDVSMMVGVRSVTEQAHRISQLVRVKAHFGSRARDPLETQALTLLLAQLAAADSGIDPIVDALCAADCALDAAQMIVSAMLAVPDPDSDDMGEGMDDMADTTQPAAASGRRPDHDGTVPSPVAEDPRLRAHSVRLSTRIRAGLIARGVQ